MGTALVLSAGGMFAAWEAWLIAGGATPADLAREWLNPATAKILRFGLHRGGLIRPDTLHAKARELFARYQPRVPFGLTVTEVPRLRQRLVRNGSVTWRHLAATCSIPFCFPPVEIQGAHYVDGGFLGALPLWAAAEMG